jgi:eukaryotic translation initiation factor 2C
MQQQMARVTGRIISPPVVQYQQPVDPDVLARGGWNLKGRRFAAPAPAATWTFLQIHFHQDDNIIGHANLDWNADQLQEAMPIYGIQQQNLFRFTGDEQTNHTLELEGGLDAWDTARNDRNENAVRRRLGLIRSKNVRLVLITLPAKNTNLYAMVKRVADVQVGIHTICAVAGWQYHRDMPTKFWAIKHNDQFLGNLLLKYNLKLGGINHWLNLPKRGIMALSTMFVGMDVTHPPPGALTGAPSIAAVVATEEPKYFVNWPASIRLQDPRKDKKSRELIDGLQAMFAERLRHWKTKNKDLPEQIIIYRDGVSDGFYDLVEEQEMPKIETAIAEAADGQVCKPRLVFVLVLKRHSTRFFPSPEKNVTSPGLFDTCGNPRPGLLVLDTLTRLNELSYFLQSHEVLKGKL